jgi:predicted enzyme related to lactoylglutathione lyase
VNTITVANLDETQAVIEAQGGSCCVPKMPVPTVGWLAYYKDLDGHIFGLMQMDPSVNV